MRLNSKKNNTRRRPEYTKNSKPTQEFTHYYRSNEASQQVAQKKDGARKKLDRIEVKKHAHTLPTYLGILVIIVSLLYASLIGGTPKVVLAPNTGLRQKPYYEQKVAEALANTPFHTSKFTFDTNAFEKNILSAIPEAESVMVAVPLAGKQPVIGIAFVQPLFLFSVSGTDYVVGNNGVVLDEAALVDSSKLEGLTKLADLAPLKVSIGTTVLLATDVQFIQTMSAELKNLQVEIGSLELPRGAGELYVTPVGQAYKIKFSLSGDAKQQVGAYAAVMKNMDSAVPTSYIDVRVGERVYVK